MNDFKSFFPDYDSFAGEDGTAKATNNFEAHFLDMPGNVFSDAYRSKIETILLARDHKNLDKKLCELETELFNHPLRNNPDTSKENSEEGREWLKKWKEEVVPLLYIAYRFMETYEEVQEKLKKDSYYLCR